MGYCGRYCGMFFCYNLTYYCGSFGLVSWDVAVVYWSNLAYYCVLFRHRGVGYCSELLWHVVLL